MSLVAKLLKGTICMLGITLSGFISFLGSGMFTVGYIANNNLFPETLSQEEEKKYIQMMDDGNEEAKNILIEHNLRLVAHVCKKYSNSNVDQDDLISIGSIGLIKGINSFNAKKNIKLSTYISKCIDNVIFTYWKSMHHLFLTFLKLNLIFLFLKHHLYLDVLFFLLTGLRESLQLYFQVLFYHRQIWDSLQLLSYSPPN